MFHFATYPNTSLHVYWVEPTVTDNMVSVNDIILLKTQSPGDLFENGTHSVQYTASDPYGNQEHCNFIIEILIQGKPFDIQNLNLMEPIFSISYSDVSDGKWESGCIDPGGLYAYP